MLLKGITVGFAFVVLNTLFLELHNMDQAETFTSTLMHLSLALVGALIVDGVSTTLIALGLLGDLPTKKTKVVWVFLCLFMFITTFGVSLLIKMSSEPLVGIIAPLLGLVFGVVLWVIRKVLSVGQKHDVNG